MAALNDNSTSTTPVTFPKIVAVCGADTTLGQNILHDLLHSAQVDKVHAIALDDFALLKQLPSSTLRKARVTITKPDRLEKALARITECDIAFCVMSTERHASSSMPRPTFSAINYGAPVRFIRRMFELGVLHVAVLSHINADSETRSEFYNLKADLEGFVRDFRREAAEFSPIISLFKMPSHVMAASASSSRATSRDPKGHDMDPSIVQVNEVAAAMQIDAFYKANIKGPPGSRRKKCHFEIFDSEDVHRILEEAEYHRSWLSPV